MSDKSSDTPYPTVGPKPDLPNIEKSILERWAKEKTFQTSIDERPENTEYVFYDGPPFANGLPHHGHLLTGYVKDVIPRYHTMRGKRVERRFGWDCHGLPAEMESEKQLGVSGRAAITDFGIQNFNEHCEKSVLKYTDDWEEIVERQARWVDFENDYKTMDLPYMESVMWAFKQLWDKGLIYESYRVMPYSWGAETPLSNFEIRLDDATRPRQDPAITVAFDLEQKPDDIGPMKILAWTTTPWTLPSNLALAVGSDIQYSILDYQGQLFILGEETVEHYETQFPEATIKGSLLGTKLLGRKYTPLFDFFVDYDPNAFQVISGDFIDTEEGTGIVHIAPGFGEDDQRIAAENQIGTLTPVDDAGCFTSEVKDWEGQNVFDASPDIIRSLRERDKLVRHDSYEHNYPHCWRTDTPIIYKAVPSWYVEVTAIREKLLELNQEINWIPSNVRDGRFGKWLEGARDWSISRNRFWGSPVPVWKSDNPEYPRIDVYGSLDELERDFGIRPDNLHRPFIDDLVRPNPDDPSGKSMMRRVPEVLDCWFESGSMPFAQVHYPFENKDWFEEHFPADFIVEYINQTRGWFYTLHVLAGALFEKPAFKNVICHGILLADDGAKLSKKLRNYTEPTEIFEVQGSDALRWYFMSSNIVRGGDSRISDQGIDDVVRQIITPIWNAYSFFTLYANIDNYKANWNVESTNLLDQYILAKTRLMVETVTQSMEQYDLPGATNEIKAFIDALNNWYIRRSRDRFWAPGSPKDDTDKQAAYDTLFTVLKVLCETSAPLLPMTAEEIYSGITSNASVHLADWPDVSSLPSNPNLVKAMDLVRDVVSTTLRVREDASLRVRLPLSSITIAGEDLSELENYLDIIKDEVNVKAVIFSDDIADHAQFILKPDGKILGPRLGESVQDVFKGAKSGNWEWIDDEKVQVGTHVLEKSEFSIHLKANEGITAGALASSNGVVILDTNVTEELINEGRARDTVRAIQEARKTQNLVVTDRIEVIVDAPENIQQAINTHLSYIADQVLAVSIDFQAINTEAMIHQGNIDGENVSISLTTVNQ
ncbi:MAG: isoleucine--tRNA ligase [Acidimicrobiaceae bacterium]|nr:isoleucine--tRNA ligase [Acidimicrobiaceae bacterium]|tara:strand:+ start:234 stop:3392 length:3159 start_codon:yes stop_codon:yes gene_type:complete